MNVLSNVERLEKTLAVIRIGLQESWNYFLAATSIGNWLYSSTRTEATLGFFYLVYDACIRSSISTLAGLLSDNKDAVTINYLLNIANDSLTSFKFAKKSDIRKSIQEQKDWLKKVNSSGAIANRIIDKRDKMIAHIDRKYATEREPGFISKNPPLSSRDIEDTYGRLMQIINLFDSYFYGLSRRQNELDMSAKDDFNYVLSLIKTMQQ